jgi:DNA processing protein
MTNNREAASYHALATAVKGDYHKLTKLHAQYGNWTTALTAENIASGDIEENFNSLKTSSIELVMREDDGFPKLLREIPHPPFALYVRGKIPAAANSLAIVGTRKATESGSELAREFAATLAGRGITIVSGLALGIDAAAHAGALAGGGKTLAVLGCGLSHIYPRTNLKLAKEIIASGGALISEYPPDAEPLPYRFLERNRIVSGLSNGVLVIEAPRESGALVTARFALDQNRDVFVLPGPAKHPHYKGSHALIREGALLVTEPDEILSAMGLIDEDFSGAETPEESKILSLLREAGKPLGIDEIIEAANIEAPRAGIALSKLSIRGQIKEIDNRYEA